MFILYILFAIYPIVFAAKNSPEYGRNYRMRYGNPEERGPYPEGDLLIPISKNGIKLESFRWKNGVIPYEIQSGFSNEYFINLLTD